MSHELAQAVIRSPARKFTLDAFRSLGKKAKSMHSMAEEIMKEGAEAASHSSPVRPKLQQTKSEGALKLHPNESESLIIRRKTEGDLPSTPQKAKSPTKGDGLWDGVNVGRSDSVTPSQSPASPSSPSKTPTRSYSRESLKPARKKLDFGKSNLEVVEESGDLGITPLRSEVQAQAKSPLILARETLFPKVSYGYPEPGSSIGRLLGHKVMNPEKYGGLVKIQKTQMSTLAFNAPNYMLEAHFVAPKEGVMTKILKAFENSVIALERACTEVKVGAYMKAYDASFAVMRVQATVKKYFGDPVNLQMLANGSKDVLVQSLAENAEAIFSLWKAAGMAGFGLITVVYANAPDPSLDKPLLGAAYPDAGNVTIKFANPVPDDDEPEVPNPHELVEVIACSSVGYAAAKSKKVSDAVQENILDQSAYALAILGFDYNDIGQIEDDEGVVLSGDINTEFPVPLILSAI